MLLPVQLNYWSQILNLIIQNYLIESTTVCIFWNDNLDFELSTEQLSENITEKQFVHITLKGVSESLHDNTYDFERKKEELLTRGLVFDELTLKLTVSIEANFCEAFIAFQDDLPFIIEAFPHAHLYSDWHSIQNRLLFVYYKENDNETEDYFNTRLFEVEPNILILEAEAYNSSIFTLKTNKFVGRENSRELYILNTYDAIDDSFSSLPVETLYAPKTDDLQGKEVSFSAPNYPPYLMYSTELQPQIPDQSEFNPTGALFVDGTEVRVLVAFCEIHNCSLKFDSSCGDTFGGVFINATGYGCVGMLLENRIVLALGGLFQWDFRYVDQSSYLGISSITCLVPAPERLTSWALPLRPFQLAVWIGVFICLTVETFGLFLNRQADQSIEISKDGQLTMANWRDSFEFAYTTTLKLFISQSTNYIVQASSLRMLLFSCYMIDIILTSSYGGGLASILTLPILGEAPDSLERMVKYDLKWTGQTIGWVEALSLSSDPIIRKIIENFYVSTFEEMTAAADSEFRGFVMEYLTYGQFANIEHLSPKAINRLKLMIDYLYRQFTVALFARDWGLQQEYNQFVLWWQANGFPMHWEWLIATQHMNAYNQRRIQGSMHPALERDPAKLDIANFIGLLLIWVLGVVLSLLAFALEIFFYKRYNKKNIDNEKYHVY